MSRLYLDHAATTPVHPRVAAAMAPWLSRDHGNPSSLHEEGRRAKDALDEAREVLSARLGCLFAEVLFTSGGTEAANWALIGAALAERPGSTMLLGAAEHHCVLHTQPILERLGMRVQLIPVDDQAQIDLNWLEDHLSDDVRLVSVMHANNEVGTLQPIAQVAALAQKVGAWFHVDAVQTLGKSDWTVDDLGADLVNLSAHKLYGPKGTGALYLRAGVKIAPLVMGGGQEREMRAGTENVAGIVGFGAAVQLVQPESSAARDAFEAALEGATFTLRPETPRLAGHSHLRFPGISAETMLIRLDRMGVAASSGAACSSGSLEPSHVLQAMGWTLEDAKQGLRFTVGAGQDADLGREAAARVNEAARAIRSAKSDSD